MSTIVNGTNTAAVTNGALHLEDRFLAIAKGEVQDHSLMLKFGRNPDIDLTVKETVWEGGGLYTFDTNVVTLEILSSDTNDVSTGAGARTMTVIGLGDNYTNKTETVSLDGTSAVALSGNWMRVHRCSIATAGVNGTNFGTITIRLSSGGATRLVVTPQNGQTLMAVYTIPAGYSGYMQSYYASANAQTAAYIDIQLLTRSSTGVINLKHQQAIISSYTMHTFSSPFKITEKADVWIDATSSANNTDVCAGFDIILIKN
jgi:hypothetical protein